MAYATAEQLETYIGPLRTLPDDADEVTRLLERASDLLDDATFQASAADDLTAEQTGHLADATCAQVESWLEWGEDQAIVGFSGQVSIRSLQIANLPPVLSPRARVHLRKADLLSTMVGVAR